MAGPSFRCCLLGPNNLRKTGLFCWIRVLFPLESLNQKLLHCSSSQHKSQHRRWKPPLFEATDLLLLESKKVMAMNRAWSFRHILTSKEVVGVACQRTFATGKAKKGSKGGGAADAPKASTLSKEIKASTVVCANILKEGTDPKILPDSEYPDWLWHLLDKRPALSELRRKNIETLPYEDLKRFVKLDNRSRIKDNNSVKAKN